MKLSFLSNLSYLFVSLIVLVACDSGTNQTAEVDVEQDTVLVQSTPEEEVATGVDLLLLTYMNTRMQNQMGELARDKAGNQVVKSFAESAASSGTEAQVKIEDMAEALNTNLPTAIKATSVATIDSIGNLDDSTFDKAYIQTIVAQYEENISNMNELINEADNPIVEGLAADIIDLQEQDLQKAAEILEEIS